MWRQGSSCEHCPSRLGVWSVAWHPRGSILATSCNDFLVYVWNVQTGQLQTVLRGHQSDVTATVFNHAGDLLATSSWDGTTRLWDPATGQQFLSTRGELRRFSEDDERLAFWHYDVMGLWQLAKPDYRMFREISHGHVGPLGAGFSVDGRLLATASDDGVRLWDLLAGGDREIAFLPLSHTISAVFSPADGSLLTAGVAGLQQWPITIDAQARTLAIGPFTTLVPPETLPCARTSLDAVGRFAAVAIRPDRIALLDLTRPAETRVVQDRVGVEFISLSPDGRWMATGVFRGAGGVRVWDVRRAEPVQTILPHSPMTPSALQPGWEVAGDQHGSRVPVLGSGYVAAGPADCPGRPGVVRPHGLLAGWPRAGSGLFALRGSAHRCGDMPTAGEA